MADFTGFYLDGIHSSTYGIIRTSDGDRYKEGLIPEFDDYDIELVGGDGDVYGGRRFKKTPFTIPIAFDHLTEKQLREFRKWIGGNQLKEFRFDERPYKAYWVKISNRPELEYVCFMENKKDGAIGEKERIYKGEGELEFMAYSPFGYCNDESLKMTVENGLQPAEGKNWQVLSTYAPFTILDDNLIEWAETSGLKNSLSGYNQILFQEKIDEQFTFLGKLYNPGDFEADFEMWFTIGEDIIDEVLVSLYIGETAEENDNGQYFKFSLKNISANSKILLNTKNHTLVIYSYEGLSTEDVELYRKNLRYDFVKSSDWLKIPIGESYIKVISAALLMFNNNHGAQIKYGYKYY